jgi:hypothetical protein
MKSETATEFKPLRLAKIAVLVVVSMQLLTAPAHASAFQSEVIDADGDAAACTAMTTDPLTTEPRIAFVRFSDTAFYEPTLLSLNNGTWATEPIGSAPLDTVDVGGGIAARMRPDGELFVAYADYNANMRVLERTAPGTWTRQLVSNGGLVSSSIALALDPTTGEPVVAFDRFDPSLHRTVIGFAYRSGGTTWHVSTIDTSGSGRRLASISVSASGAVAVAYIVPTGLIRGEVFVAKASSVTGSFSIQAPPLGFDATRLSVAQDPTSGVVCLAAIVRDVSSNAQLVYAAESSPGTWDVTTAIDSSVPVFSNDPGQVALVPRSTGAPDICYLMPLESPEYSTKFASRSSSTGTGTFSIDVVLDQAGNIGFGRDKHGNPIVSLTLDHPSASRDITLSTLVAPLSVSERTNMTSVARVIPNPWPGRGSARITFESTVRGQGQVDIFDSQGRRLDVQDLGTLDAGSQWREISDARLNPGQYFLKIRVGLVSVAASRLVVVR